MDKNMAGVLVKAQRDKRSAGEAYARITAQINIFKGMPRARFDGLWAEAAAARPAGKLRPSAMFAQWVGNLTGARRSASRPVAAPARRPGAAAAAPTRTAPVGAYSTPADLVTPTPTAAQRKAQRKAAMRQYLVPRPGSY